MRGKGNVVYRTYKLTIYVVPIIKFCIIIQTEAMIFASAIEYLYTRTYEQDRQPGKWCIAAINIVNQQWETVLWFIDGDSFLTHTF